MPEPKELAPGDPCPVDGGTLVKIEGAAVKDEAELYRCQTCGYMTRFPAEADVESEAGAEGERESAAPPRRRRK